MRGARWGLLLLGVVLVGGVPLGCAPFELVGGTARLPEYGFTSRCRPDGTGPCGPRTCF